MTDLEFLVQACRLWGARRYLDWLEWLVLDDPYEDRLPEKRDAQKRRVAGLERKLRQAGWYAKFEEAADELRRRGPSPGVDPLVHEAMIEGMESELENLR